MGVSKEGMEVSVLAVFPVCVCVCPTLPVFLSTRALHHPGLHDVLIEPIFAL